MSKTDPIRVFARDGTWLVDYGSYVHGSHETRGEAVRTATIAAAAEGRELELGWASTGQARVDHDQTVRHQDQTRSDEDQAASDLDQRTSDRDQTAADDDLAAGGDPASHRRTTLARQQSTSLRDDASANRATASTARMRVAADRDQAAGAELPHPGIQAGHAASADPSQRLTLAQAPSTDNLRLVYANDQADEFRRNVNVDPSGLFRFEGRHWTSPHTEQPNQEGAEPAYLLCIEQPAEEAPSEGLEQSGTPA